MNLLHQALRLLCASALIMIAAIALSVMTHDAWLTVGHVAGAASALIAAVAVLALAVAGLRRLAQGLPQALPDEGEPAPHERGLTGLEPAAGQGRPSGWDGLSNP